MLSSSKLFSVDKCHHCPVCESVGRRTCVPCLLGLHRESEVTKAAQHGPVSKEERRDRGNEKVMHGVLAHACDSSTVILGRDR